MIAWSRCAACTLRPFYTRFNADRVRKPRIGLAWWVWAEGFLHLFLLVFLFLMYISFVAWFQVPLRRERERLRVFVGV